MRRSSMNLTENGNETGATNPLAAGMTLESIVEQFYQPLFRFAMSLSRNPSDASDLTQQTFYIAQTRLHQLKDGSKLKSWLFTTLMREHLQRRRHETRFPKVEIGEAESELPGVVDESAVGMDSKLILDALKSLDEKSRQPLILFYLDSKPYHEIGRILNIPIGTVMSRLSRAKQQLREIMEKSEMFGWRGITQIVR